MVIVETLEEHYRDGGALYAGARGVESGASSIGTAVSGAANLLARELFYRPRYPLSLTERVTAWRHGFSSKTYASLDLSGEHLEEYLSDWQQKRDVHGGVNGEYVEVLENKLAFHVATDPYVETLPTLYGTIESGTFSPTEDCSTDDLGTLLERTGDLVVKPIGGRLGKDVYHVRFDGDYVVNDSRLGAAEFDRFVARLDGFLVSEFVTQHEYADAIAPGSVNTVRVLTIRPPGSDDVEAVRAVHRFGSAETTGPTDNWSGGGCAAPVDEETGELGQVATYSREGGKRRAGVHPETGAQVEGRTVPEWESILEAVTAVATVHRANPYVGWDVVLSENGPVILEGNPAPGNVLLQIDEGLLADERIRAVFAEWR